MVRDFNVLRALQRMVLLSCERTARQPHRDLWRGVQPDAVHRIQLCLREVLVVATVQVVQADRTMQSDQSVRSGSPRYDLVLR